MNKPLIIFDPDMDTDCDDVGALAILYEYVKKDKAELLGIITDAPSGYAAPFCEAMGELYDIKRPIGAVSSDTTLLKYNVTTEYYQSERYDDHDAYTAPWMPNASANGRVLDMLFDYYGKKSLRR